MNARERNQRIKAASRAITAAGLQIGAVEITPDGTVRVLAANDVRPDDEAARVGRLIEERMGNG